MSRKFAWMLILAAFVLMAGVVGCASDESSRATSKDSPYASGRDNGGSNGSGH